MPASGGTKRGTFPLRRSETATKKHDPFELPFARVIILVTHNHELPDVWPEFEIEAADRTAIPHVGHRQRVSFVVRDGSAA